MKKKILVFVFLCLVISFSQALSKGDFFKIKLEVKSRKHQEFLKRIGLNCPEIGECVCQATIEQTNQLRRAHFDFSMQRERKGTHKKTALYKSAFSDTTYRPIKLEPKKKGEPPDKELIRYKKRSLVPSDSKGSIDVWGYLDFQGDEDYYDIETGEGYADLYLTSIPPGCDYDLYLYDENLEVVASSVNGDTLSEHIYTYIDQECYTIGVRSYYGYSTTDSYHLYGTYPSPPQPDLVILSLTSTDYDPTVGEYIDITLVIKNQGNLGTGNFYTDLFLNESFPPTPPATGDCWWRTSLGAGETESHTFYDITSSVAETWQMYGLTDSEDEISESNENNNVKGPVNVVWEDPEPKPDLIVEDFCIGTDAPDIGDSVNIIVVIKNQGDASAHDFWTDLFYDSPFPPTPPADGDDWFYTSSLSSGQTKAWAFYIANDEADEWSIYVLVDSWNNVEESNEGNNVWGPEYVSWGWPSKRALITREEIITNAYEFIQVFWQCPSQNATPPPASYCVYPNNDQTWSSDFVVDNWYTGEAYEWGGWDKVDVFQINMANGQRAGVHLGNDCLPDTLSNPCWSTGIDCSGFVSRCWELNYKHSTRTLFNVAHGISYDSLKMGDALDDTTALNNRHVSLFSEIPAAGLVCVMESRSYGIGDTLNRCDTNTYTQDYLVGRDFIPIRYNNVYDPATNNDPEIVGHLHCKYPYDECNECIKYGNEFVLEIIATDPDGDSMYYEWFTYYGWFIVEGQYVYACTTAENFVNYLAPSFPHTWDQLSVTVRDVRDGWASIEEWLDVYDQGTSCLCGDADVDGRVLVNDAVYILGYLYGGGPPPPDPIERADANNDCSVNNADVIYLLTYFFGGGPPPVCCWIHQ